MLGSAVFRQRRGAYLAVLIVTLGTVLATAFHYAQGNYRGLGFPANSFLSGQSTLFFGFRSIADVTDYRGLAGTRYETSPVVMVLFKALHAVMGDWGGILLVALLAATVFVWFSTGWRGLLSEPVVRAHHVAALVLLSYPLLLCYEAAAPETLAFVLLCLFLTQGLRGGRDSHLAWIALGAAIAVDWTLALLLILSISRQDWGQARKAIAVAVGLTGLAVIALAVGTADSLGSAWSVTLAAAGSFGLDGAASHVAARGHSIWGGLVALDMRFGLGITDLPHARAVYATFCGIVVVAVAAFLYRRRPPDWQSLALILVCVTALPFWSADTGMVFLLAPLLLLTRSFPGNAWLWLVVVLMSLLLVPLDYLPIDGAISSATVLYPLLLVCLAVTIVLSVGGFERRDGVEVSSCV